MPTYTVNQNGLVDAAQGICVTDPATNQPGSRLVFQSTGDWVHVPGAGRVAAAGANHPGIYTSGQFQCIAIIVAKFGGQGGWQAWLAHVSHPKHSLLTGTSGLISQADNTSYVAIGARASSLNWMNSIATDFAAKNPLRIWIYAANNSGSPDFGMNRQGYFGETVPWISATHPTTQPRGQFLR